MRFQVRLFTAIIAACLTPFAALGQEKRVGFQGTASIPSVQQAAVYVEPAALTDTFQQALPTLNVGIVTADADIARGAQKAGDVWGLNVDLFVARDPEDRQHLVSQLLEHRDRVILVDALEPVEWRTLAARAQERGVMLTVLETSKEGSNQRFADGFAAVRAARADILPAIPKYDQLLPIAFPISPLPDSFFQPSKFPYPKPLVRVDRTAESFSATAHAHTSCNMVAQTGNMLHRTSGIDPNVFLMGMEGGNLSLKAMPGAVDARKVAAVMTSWVMAIRGETSARRDVIVENDGTSSSFFKPATHAPEELELALDAWKTEGRISGHRRVGDEEVVLDNWDGATRRLRAGMFLVASDHGIRKPELVAGIDVTGRHALDFYSTQNFVQQFVEIPPNDQIPHPQDLIQPHGGILTAGGTSVGNTVGSRLRDLFAPVPQHRPDFQPYRMRLEGGFFVVTPEQPLTLTQWDRRVDRVDLDLRGPLTSDQTISVTLDDHSHVIFRRTVLNFEELDKALTYLRTLGLIGDWTYDGARGRGLNANVVLQHFLGKHRKFMSSLATWPNEERPERPIIRFYVDGMQRLNFTFISADGWRQEFVEVPLRIPPVPRDIELYSGVNTLD